jgi:GntR family transcriptional regulator
MAESTGRIDFDSNIPYYVQLINHLKAQIKNGIWKPGDQFPGEHELGREYGVSRTVIRQALAEMEQEGLILRRKGKGTYVAQPKIAESLAQKLTGFYQDMTERGLKPVTQVLHQRVTPANERTALYLEITPGTLVVDIMRLRFVNDAPIQVVTSYIPYALCPKVAEVDLTNRSLYTFLENECGLLLSHGKRFIEAVAANESEAKLLQVKRGAPLIMLDSVSYLEDCKPVEYYHALHRGDRSRFEIELVRVRNQGNPLDELRNKVGNLPRSNDIIP